LDTAVRNYPSLALIGAVYCHCNWEVNPQLNNTEQLRYLAGLFFGWDFGLAEMPTGCLCGSEVAVFMDSLKRGLLSEK
jgi:hypothetical protein